MRHVLLLLACAVGLWSLTASAGCGDDCADTFEPQYREPCSDTRACVEPYVCRETEPGLTSRCLLPCADDCPCDFTCEEMTFAEGTSNYCLRRP